MRIHDDFDLAGGARRSAHPAKGNDVSGEIGAALANPKTASVQAMLEVQRLAGNSGVSKLLQREDEAGQPRSPVLDVVGKGGGAPMPDSLRGEMEGRLGADFSDVKVHTDSRASESAQSVQANAYTVGNDVVVRQDRWAPDTDEGKKTIAHELTHVMQQRAGPVDGTSTGSGISVSNPSDRFERAAESNAEAVMAAPGPMAATGASGTSAQLHAEDDVQRQIAQREGAEEEEETAQGQFVQREGGMEEEEEATAQGEFVQREGGMEEEEEATAQGEFVQRQGTEEEEEPTAQGQFVQREAAPEEEEEATAQGQFVQREAAPEEEEEATAQGQFVQRRADRSEDAAPLLG